MKFEEGLRGINRKRVETKPGMEINRGMMMLKAMAKDVNRATTKVIN